MYIPRGTLIRDTKLTKTVNVIPLKAVRLKIHLNILSKTGCHFFYCILTIQYIFCCMDKKKTITKKVILLCYLKTKYSAIFELLIHPLVHVLLSFPIKARTKWNEI